MQESGEDRSANNVRKDSDTLIQLRNEFRAAIRDLRKDVSAKKYSWNI